MNFMNSKCHDTNRKAYGIQIRTYQELVNLMRLADNLKNSYKKDVTVQVKVLNVVKYYGLIVGKFRYDQKQNNSAKNWKKISRFIVGCNRM